MTVQNVTDTTEYEIAIGIGYNLVLVMVHRYTIRMRYMIIIPHNMTTELHCYGHYRVFRTLFEILQKVLGARIFI